MKKENIRKPGGIFIAVFSTSLLLMLTGCGAGEKGAAQLISSSGGAAQGNDIEMLDQGETDMAASAEKESAAMVSSEPPVLSLTPAQVHRGDLILVSADHEYDFEANADLELVNIKETQTYDYPVDKDEFMLARKAMSSLDAMIRDCDEAMGSSLTSVSSAWRSKEYQQSVWDEYEELYGEEYVTKYVAVPGCSEHHTGLALDLGITYEDGSAGTFSESENAGWMAQNAYRYGFVRRYAEDKTAITGISNEAWHFRYVGQPHATYMTQRNECLEEYLEDLRGHTSPSEPLETEAAGHAYKVFYTSEETIEEPDGEWTVSGDNAGGFIVTVLAD